MSILESVSHRADDEHAPTVYNFLADPGHGWLVVERAELRALGIEHAISPYSYVSPDGRMAYLEEDCDFTTFHRAKEQAGEFFRYETTHVEHHCHVRRYPQYPSAADWRARARALAEARELAQTLQLRSWGVKPA